MMEDTITVMFVCAAMLAGFYFNQIWLSIIFAIVLLAVMIPQKKTSKAPVNGPAVRPIIVKRKYVGPESIYPKEMKVRITHPDVGGGTPWAVDAPKTIGEGIGRIIKNVSKWLE